MTPEARTRVVLNQHARRLLRGVLGTRTSSHDTRKPWCDDPQLVYQRHDTRKGGALAHKVPSLETSGYYPCRKCEKCIVFRRLKWRERSRRELREAGRTWFVTLTFSDLHLAGIHMEAAASMIEDREKALERAAYRHVQRYLKRIRKAGRTQFRYLAVFELGSLNGRGHYHLFIHEKAGCKPVLKRTLDDEWRSFVSAKLVDVSDAARAAAYVSKYITKSPVSRPRASLWYGKDRPSRSTMPRSSSSRRGRSARIEQGGR